MKDASYRKTRGRVGQRAAREKYSGTSCARTNSSWIITKCKKWTSSFEKGVRRTLEQRAWGSTFPGIRTMRKSHKGNCQYM